MPPSDDPRKQSKEGPWLDRLFPIRLPDGRRVSVTGFSVLPSNYGILEGGLSPAINAMQRAKVLALAEERYGDPVVAVEPAIVPLPEISRRRTNRGSASPGWRASHASPPSRSTRR